MEPVTHVLTGICLARSGIRERTAYATVAMGIAAEFPDIDTVWSAWGPVSGFEHHRGITHTFLGLPCEASFLLLCIYILHRTLRACRSGKPSVCLRPPLKPEPRWGVLFFGLLLALFSHLLLDFTNNYGVRPFFPFSPHWYVASVVFIVDPLLLCVLTASLVMPALQRLVGREIRAVPDFSNGRRWAKFALIFMPLLWGFRVYERNHAVALAREQVVRQPAAEEFKTQSAADPVALGDVKRPFLHPLRISTSPDPISPFRWYTVTDFGPVYQLGTADTANMSYAPGLMLHKPVQNRAVATAERTHLGRVYLGWSLMPLVVAKGVGSTGQTDVLFEDLRFLNASPFLQRQSNPPLTGEVVLGNTGEVVAEGMDGRFGR